MTFGVKSKILHCDLEKKGSAESAMCDKRHFGGPVDRGSAATVRIS